jgi:guanosine-3',5'-bis(diphosphate) 3'-pyrophosphohydrolase
MNITRLLHALDYAARKHTGQCRKGAPGTTPYINHPIDVTHLLAEVGNIRDEDVLVASILHDTVEDTDATPEELERLFGPNVRRMVEEVTDDKNLPKAERKRLQIQHAPQLSPGAALIRLADKCSNVRDIHEAPPADWPPSRILDYLSWAEKVIAACPPVNPALEALFRERVQTARQHLLSPR